jgi:hypothetical protein
LNSMLLSHLNLPVASQSHEAFPNPNQWASRLIVQVHELQDAIVAHASSTSMFEQYLSRELYNFATTTSTSS